MIDLISLKAVHVTCVGLSLLGFLVRGGWMLRCPERLEGRWVRTLPHLNDTLLLASGVGMLWLLRLSPLTAPWVMAKLTALVAYILLGAMALRYGRRRRLRAAAFVSALAVFMYIVSVAITKQPLPF